MTIFPRGTETKHLLTPDKAPGQMKITILLKSNLAKQWVCSHYVQSMSEGLEKHG